MVKSSIPGVFSVTSLFLMTLSSKRPRPVSALASLASSSPNSSIFMRILLMMRPRSCNGISIYFFWAAKTASTAEFISGKIPLVNSPTLDETSAFSLSGEIRVNRETICCAMLFICSSLSPAKFTDSCLMIYGQMIHSTRA